MSAPPTLFHRSLCLSNVLSIRFPVEKCLDSVLVYIYMPHCSLLYFFVLQLYKLEIDSFRADRVRPARHSLISMECVAADDVKDRLKDVTEEYHDLGSRCHSLGDRLADLSGKHRQFNDSAFKLLGWLTETEEQLANLKQEPGSPEPAQLQAQLDRLKSLSMDALSQRGLLDEMQRRGQDLTNRWVCRWTLYR